MLGVVDERFARAAVDDDPASLGQIVSFPVRLEFVSRDADLGRSFAVARNLGCQCQNFP